MVKKILIEKKNEKSFSHFQSSPKKIKKIGEKGCLKKKRFFFLLLCHCSKTTLGSLFTFFFFTQGQKTQQAWKQKLFRKSWDETFFFFKSFLEGRRKNNGRRAHAKQKLIFKKLYSPNEANLSLPLDLVSAKRRGEETQLELPH